MKNNKNNKKCMFKKDYILIKIDVPEGSISWFIFTEQSFGLKLNLKILIKIQENLIKVYNRISDRNRVVSFYVETNSFLNTCDTMKNVIEYIVSGILRYRHILIINELI